MRVYKGDLVQRVYEEESRIHIDDCWGREVMGVKTNIDLPETHWRLFQRPLRNYIKDIIITILKWFFE